MVPFLPTCDISQCSHGGLLNYLRVAIPPLKRITPGSKGKYIVVAIPGGEVHS